MPQDTMMYDDGGFGGSFGEEMPMDGQMGGEMPMDSQMGGEMPNQFDTNFDAGVEADEATDPKKYIQQLTGKLSQSLRNYNSGQPQADADLNKYVAGMIVKQTIEGLSPDDVQDILTKVKSDDTEQQPTDDGGQGQPMEDPNQMNGGAMPNGQMESKLRHGKQLKETVVQQDINDDNKDTQSFIPKNKRNYSSKAYLAPEFK